MPDYRAGSEVLALDWPPSVEAYDATTITDPSNSSYSAGSPTVAVTFTAPTSGRVLLIIGGGLGNGGPGKRIFLSPQVFLGTSASGTEILSPTAPTHGFGSHNTSNAPHYGTRETVLEGLTPGSTYYARVMHLVASGDSGSATADISARQITVVPIP